jgi:O-antigen/teichoic acid export membrane protein
VSADVAIVPAVATANLAPAVSLTKRMLRAGGWVGAGQLFSYALRLGSTLVMTRLLAPEMFGVMAVVTIVITVMTMLSDVGLHPSIVRSERGDETAFLDTAWTVQIVRGLLMWFAAALVALAIHLASGEGLIPAGSTYAEPLLPVLILISALASVITGFQSTNLFLAYRHLSMGRVVLLDALVQLVGIVVSVALAWHWRSVWALVGGSLTSAFAQAILTHRLLPGPGNRLRWEKPALDELAGLGGAVMLSSTISVLAMNMDRILLGGMVGPERLGLYTIALTLSGVAFSVIARVTSTVSLPALSEVRRRGEADFRAAYFRLRRLSDVTMLAAGGLICALGEVLVRVLYDARYQEAGVILSILGLSLLGSRYAIMQQVYLALGQASRLVWLNGLALLALLVLVPATYAAFGFLAAVAAVALKDLATLPLIYYFNRQHGLNDLGYELRVLLVAPLAYGVGRLLALLLAPLLS